MKQLIPQALAWKMAIVYFCLFSINALGTSIMSALIGAKWETLDSQQKFMIGVGVLTNWTGLIMAFFSKSAQKIDKGVTPSDTGFWQTDPGFDPNKTTSPTT